MEENKNEPEKCADGCNPCKRKHGAEPSRGWGECIASKAIRDIKAKESKVDWKGEARLFVRKCEAEGVDPVKAVAHLAGEWEINLAADAPKDECKAHMHRFLNEVAELIGEDMMRKDSEKRRLRDAAQDRVIDLLAKFFSDTAEDDDGDHEGSNETECTEDECYPRVLRRFSRVKTIYYGE